MREKESDSISEQNLRITGYKKIGIKLRERERDIYSIAEECLEIMDKKSQREREREREREKEREREGIAYQNRI